MWDVASGPDVRQPTRLPPDPIHEVDICVWEMPPMRPDDVRRYCHNSSNAAPLPWVGEDHAWATCLTTSCRLALPHVATALAMPGALVFPASHYPGRRSLVPGSSALLWEFHLKLCVCTGLRRSDTRTQASSHFATKRGIVHQPGLQI